MPQTHSPQSFTKWVAVAALLAVLTACGGGGGGGGGNNPPPNPTPSPTPTPEPDTTPDAISFTSVTDVEKGSTVSSETKTITGIDSPTPISVENGEYAINGGDFASAEGTVSDGDRVVIRITASSQFSDPVMATVTVGGVETTFTVTTEARDITPEQFSFVDEQDVDFSTEIESGPVTIQGINDAAPVRVEGGEYSINGGAYTTVEGMVEAGDTVTVRGTSASMLVTGVDVTLRVGDESNGEVSDTFTITTLADTTAPVAEIYYPPKLSLTTDATVRVRGTASDDYSTITSVTVNGVEADTTDGYATWTAVVDVVPDSSTAITVVTTDSAGQADNTAASANIVHRSDFSGAFPDSENAFSYPYDLAFHPDTGNLIISDGALDGIFLLNLENNTRSLLFDNVTPDDSMAIEQYESIQMDVSHDAPRLLVADYKAQAVVSVDMTSGAKTIFTSNSVPDSSNPLGRIVDMAIDPVEHKLILATNEFPTGSSPPPDFQAGELALISVSLSDGTRETISSNTVPNSEYPFEDLQGISLDVENRIAYVAGGGGGSQATVWAVNLEDGQREIISDSTTPNSDNMFIGFPSGVAFDESRKRLLVSNSIGTSVGEMLAVNLDSDSPPIGARTPFIDDTPEPNTSLTSFTRMSIDNTKDLLYVVSTYSSRPAIFVVDVTTGQRVFLSKNVDSEDGG